MDSVPDYLYISESMNVDDIYKYDRELFKEIRQ